MAGKKVAITGATTPLGNVLTALLRKNGYEVVELSRSLLLRPIPDITKHIDGCDVLCNLQGVPFESRWTGRYQYDIYADRITTIHNLSQALNYCEERPKVFMGLSNAMIYDKYEVHTDFSTSYGDGFMSEVGRMETAEMMKLKKQYIEKRLIILRSGYVMCRRGGVYPILRRLSRLHLAGVIDDGYQCIPIVHIDDAARAILFLIESENAEGIFNISIPEMCSMRELVDSIKKYQRGFQLPMPHALLRSLAGRATELFEQNCKVSPQRLTDMGFEFLHPNIDNVIKTLARK